MKKNNPFTKMANKTRLLFALLLLAVANVSFTYAQNSSVFSRVYRSITDTTISFQGSISTLLYDSTENALYFSLNGSNQSGKQYSKLYKTDINGSELTTYLDTAQLFDISCNVSVTNGAYIYWLSTKENWSSSTLKVLKTDMSLNKVWEREFGMMANRRQTMVLLNTGELLLSSSDFQHAQFIKLDNSGTSLQNDTVALQTGAVILDMIANPDGSYIVCDASQIVGRDISWSPQWTASKFGYCGGELAITEQEPGYVYISSGKYTSIPVLIDGGYVNGSIQKIAKNGTMDATKVYTKYTGNSNVYVILNDGYQSICSAINNGCAAAGKTGLNKQFGEINRVDSNLNVIWDYGYSYDSTKSSSLSKIISLPDGSFVAAGSASAHVTGIYEEQLGWLLRVDSNGCYNSTCSGFIEPEMVSIKNIPANAFKIFPNPSNDRLNMSFQHPFSSDARIIITDISGRNVARLTVPKNASNYNIDTQHWNNGIYLMMIENDDQRYYQKIVIQH